MGFVIRLSVTTEGRVESSPPTSSSACVPLASMDQTVSKVNQTGCKHSVNKLLNHYISLIFNIFHFV